MNIFGVGPLEVLIVMVVALIFIGPAELPTLARQLGRAIYEFRRASAELTEAFAQQYADEVAAREAVANPEAALEPALVTADGQIVEVGERVDSSEFSPEAGYAFTPASGDSNVETGTTENDASETTQQVWNFGETSSESDSSEESNSSVEGASTDVVTAAASEAVAETVSAVKDDSEAPEWPLARMVAVDTAGADTESKAPATTDVTPDVDIMHSRVETGEAPVDEVGVGPVQESAHNMVVDGLEETVKIEDTRVGSSNGNGESDVEPVDKAALPLNGSSHSRPRRTRRKTAEAADATDEVARVAEAQEAVEVIVEDNAVAPKRRRVRAAKTEVNGTEETVISQPRVAMTESKE